MTFWRATLRPRADNLHGETEQIVGEAHHAMDTFHRSGGTVAARRPEFLHARRVHSPAARAGCGGGTRPAHSGPSGRLKSPGGTLHPPGSLTFFLSTTG